MWNNKILFPIVRAAGGAALLSTTIAVVASNSAENNKKKKKYAHETTDDGNNDNETRAVDLYYPRVRFALRHPFSTAAAAITGAAARTSTPSASGMTCCEAASTTNQELSSAPTFYEAVGSEHSRSRMTPFSRLARRRTIKRMEETKEKVTLESKYAVEGEPIGEGAYGAVYIGNNRATGEVVAVKKIEKEFTDNTMFQREMDALMHIRTKGGHPNICGLQENFDEGDYYFFILDLVAGGEMFDHLCAEGPYSEADAARLIREVGSALAFLHGIGVVHGDLKPENLMLSSRNPLVAVIKLVDFGCAQIKETGDIIPNRSGVATTVAYCPPEVILSHPQDPIDSSFDMWALGIILYIMLTGIHPFDIECNATDEQVQDRILSRQPPPLRNHTLTKHLSESAIDLIEKLVQWEPQNRMSAHELLSHPWVRGETASKGKIADSDKRLSMFHAYRPSLEAQVFKDMVTWSEQTFAGNADAESRRQSLLERSFQNLDPTKRGYITKSDLHRLSKRKTLLDPTKQDNTSASSEESQHTLSLSAFSDLLSENMKNRYFPKGHCVYREGETGDKMYFINSGTIEVSSNDGHVHFRSQGDSFGASALLSSKKLRSNTVKCTTPVHAIEINREFFERYKETDDSIVPSLLMKGKSHKQDRAKKLLRSQPNMKRRVVKKGEYIFKEGDHDDTLCILDTGKVDIMVKGRPVFSLNERGDMYGEHAVMFQRPRNASALCVSSNHCAFHVLDGVDFRKLMDSHPFWFKESLHDICCSREFQKALAMKTKTSSFLNNEQTLRAAFDSADINNSGELCIENVRTLLLDFDSGFSEKDIQRLFDQLDLNSDGFIGWEEFKRLFVNNNKSSQQQ